MRHDQEFSSEYACPCTMARGSRDRRAGAVFHIVDIPRYLRMIASGRFDPVGMVSHRGTLVRNQLTARYHASRGVHSLVGRVLMESPATQSLSAVFVLSVSSDIGEQLALHYLDLGLRVAGTYRQVSFPPVCADRPSLRRPCAAMSPTRESGAQIADLSAFAEDFPLGSLCLLRRPAGSGRPLLWLRF
jgi:hypothetical protein